MPDDNETQAQAAFRDAQQKWRTALEGHRKAPPDAGFSARLRELAEAARAEAVACRSAHAAGFESRSIARRRAIRRMSFGLARGAAGQRSGGGASPSRCPS